MKLEGTYQSGIFRTVKMYRLFDEAPIVASHSDDGSDEAGAAAAAAVAAAAVSDSLPYTRCKGVHRKTAQNLKDDVFLQNSEPFQVVVHRSTLRPTRAGEIYLTRESKSLAVPFNLKRRVDATGTHTVCFKPPTRP